MQVGIHQEHTWYGASLGSVAQVATLASNSHAETTSKGPQGAACSVFYQSKGSECLSTSDAAVSHNTHSGHTLCGYSCGPSIEREGVPTRLWPKMLKPGGHW